MSLTAGFEKKDWSRPIPEGAFGDANRELMRIIFATALANVPVPVSDDEEAAAVMTIVCDASEWGWCAVGLAGEQIYTRSMPWSDEDRRMYNVQSSVTAEPLGILRACLILLPPTAHGTVTILTDHSSLMLAASAPVVVHCNEYHSCLDRLRVAFPRLKFVFRFIPGKSNIADRGSRGDAIRNSAQDTRSAIELTIEASMDRDMYIRKNFKTGGKARRAWMV